MAAPRALHRTAPGLWPAQALFGADTSAGETGQSRGSDPRRDHFSLRLLSLVFGMACLTASAGGATTALVGTGFEDATAARSFWTLLSGCEFRTVACACRALVSLALGPGMAFARGGWVCAAGVVPGAGL